MSAREQPATEESENKENEWMARFEQMNATITQLKTEKENMHKNNMMQQMPFMHPMMGNNGLMQQYQHQMPLHNSTNMYNIGNGGNYGNSNNNNGRKKCNPGKNFPFYNRYC